MTSSLAGEGMSKGMGGHHRSQGASDEWYTPVEVFEALELDFDLDPCAPALPSAPWIPAAARISLPDDGLTAPWRGRVWMNPPYGRGIGRWMRRIAAHGDGVALVFARTDTAWFHETVGAASALCFIQGRLNFIPSDPRHVAPNRTSSSSGAPSMLVAYGQECAEAVAQCGMGLVFAVHSTGLLGQAQLWESR